MLPGGLFGGRMRAFSTRPRSAALVLTTAALMAWPLSLAFAEPARSTDSTAIARAVNHVAPANPAEGRDIGKEIASPPAAGPLAHATKANVNSVLPDIKLNFIYGTKITGPPTAPTGKTLRAPKGTILLQGDYLFPAFSNEGIFGGCKACTGSGHFLRAHRGSIAPFAKAFHHKASDFRCSPGRHFAGCIPPQFIDHTFSDVVRGEIIMGSKTRFVEAALGAEIGRFDIFDVDVARHKPRPIQSGCTPAYLDAGVSSKVITTFLLGHIKDLPTVPCRQRVPPGSRAAIHLPLQFSSTSGVHGSIKVHASTPEWEIAFQEPANSIRKGQPNCLPNALAEVSRTTLLSEVHVRRGTTTIHYTSAKASGPGFTCVYLQVGRRLIDPKVTIRLPDGRVAATASRPFLGGGTMRLAAPQSISATTNFSVTASGTAPSNGPQDAFVMFTHQSSCAQSIAAAKNRGDVFLTFQGNDGVRVPQGGYSVKTDKVHGGIPGSGLLCGYLYLGTESTTSKPEAHASRSITFT
jgi:hypothetical protein